MKNKINFPIDFVITWVNPNDVSWQAKFNKYKFRNNDEESEIRFRDYGTLKYVFRSIEKYAPWVNKVFLVTDQQKPSWLNTNNSKLECINHEDFIDKKYLPTFNSNVIDLNLYKIDGLSEHFVYFNDDMFLNGRVSPEDFFDVNGMPRDTLSMNVIMPNSDFDHIYVNNMSLINKEFSKKKVLKNQILKLFTIKNREWILLNLLQLPWPRFSRFFDPHTQLSFKKSTIKRYLEKNKEVLTMTNKEKFRSANDYSIWIVRYYQMLMGDFSTRNIHFGVHYAINEYKKISKDIARSKHKLLNINDAMNMSDNEFERAVDTITREFEKKLNVRSSFEK